jgi:hypothetical protein
MIPNAVRPAQATNDHTAGIALRSARYARPPPHSMPVRMKPCASMMKTPTLATKSGGSLVAAITPAGSDGASRSLPLAWETMMRMSWAMLGNMANATAMAWRRGTAWKDCSTMSTATNRKIGTRAAFGSTCAMSGM